MDEEVEEDGEGWTKIERVGGWNAFLCRFDVIEEVPSQHEAAWSWAWSQVLRKIQMAEDGKDLDRALMWLSFLPQALLVKARRGGRAGRGNVAFRFNCIGRQPNEEKQKEIKRKAVVKLVSEGKISKAVNRIKSYGLADMSDEVVQ